MIRYQFEFHRSAAYDEEQCIGECDYGVQDGRWIITRTVVSPLYTEEGIARHLVLLVEEQCHIQGMPLIATCSYAQKVLNSLS